MQKNVTTMLGVAYDFVRYEVNDVCWRVDFGSAHPLLGDAKYVLARFWMVTR